MGRVKVVGAGYERLNGWYYRRPNSELPEWLKKQGWSHTTANQWLRRTDNRPWYKKEKDDDSIIHFNKGWGDEEDQVAAMRKKNGIHHPGEWLCSSTNFGCSSTYYA